MPEPLSVFISYSQKDEAYREAFVTHCATLQQQGWIDAWHDGLIPTGEEWEDAILGKLRSAQFVMCLVSANSLASEYCCKERDDALARGKQCLVIPVILDDCDWQASPFGRLQALPKQAAIVPVALWENQNSGWNSVIQSLRQLIREWFPTRAKQAAWPKPKGQVDVNIHRLPTPGPTFVGRTDELARLDAAWTNPDVRIFSVVAAGGFGKSALVHRWTQQLQADGWRGAERVFAWSFYSQGTAEAPQAGERGSRRTAASGEPFLIEALEWFGWEGGIPASANKKGEVLADLVASTRTLLILDGLEPLQQSSELPGEAGHRLLDPGIKAFLRQLATSNAEGLCVLTTRLQVADLASREASTAPVLRLEKLEKATGAALLEAVGVTGPRKELERVSKEFEGHALTLQLFGTYLVRYHGGGIKHRTEVPSLVTKKGFQNPVERVFKAYVEQMTPEQLRVLLLLGLFDRPAEPEAVEAVRAEPAIAGLTEGISAADEEAWVDAVVELEDLGLLRREGGALDAHPLVRESFGARLQTEHAEAWRQGNRRLYEYYQASTDEFPETLEQMLPLYTAVVHGCRAGLEQEALHEVLFKRIKRASEFYSTKKLGAFGSELTALAALFERPWDRPAVALTAAAQAWLLNQAAFVLRALGRLSEAVAPMEAALELGIKQENWKAAATRASNLSELTLTLGRVADAVEFGARGVELADRSGDEFQRMGNRTTQADALHQAGVIEAESGDASAARFAEAEALQAERQPQYPKLYSVQGYQYCDLLLTQCARAVDVSAVDLSAGERAEKLDAVRQRAETTLAWLTQAGKDVLSVALDHLTLGRVHLALEQVSEAALALERAVAGLRQAGHEWFLPAGLLARAALHRHTGDGTSARRDLDEALEIAERGSMRLHEADAHLEWARLLLSEGKVEEARGHVAVARRIVDETGYGRRQPEIAELEERLAVGSG